MGRKSVLFILILGVAVLAGVGCPLRPQTQRFTSADPDLYYGLNGIGALAEDDTGTAGSREVVEPDVYHREGNLLYVLNQYRGLSIVDLDTNAVLAQVPTYGSPRDLYVRDTRAFVLVAYASDYEVNGNTVRYTTNARLYVVDVADPAEAAILSSFELAGDLVDSRLVGDVLYGISADYEYYWLGGGETVSKVTSDSWVTSVNIADPANIFQVDEVSFASLGNLIHATESAIFVAAPDWSADTTRITYVDISDPSGAIAVRGSVDVPGTVPDRFKMDAYDGYLRVVSYARADERRIHLTTVSLANPGALTVAAATEVDRARGDSLFATRFDGDRAYIVTYLVVDPLFVVDLSDPTNPQVVGELEVPGWSTHIEPRGDRLIALGVDDTDGRKVCVSLFDVSNPAAPALLDRELFGDEWSWSTAQYDVKAFTVMDDVLIVPVSGYASDSGWYERLQFVSHTPDTLTVRGSIDLDGEAIRSFKYEDAFYGLGAQQLVTIDASDLDAPQVVNRLVLAENVADFVELSASVGAHVITRSDTGMTVVRPAGLPLKSLPQAEVDIGSLAGAYAWEESVVLVGRSYDPEPEYRVAIVDCSDPANPQAGEVIRVAVTPMYEWVWWPYDATYAAEAVDKAVLPYISDTQPASFILGDLLVLRCLDGGYDARIGGDEATQGYATVDLAEGEWTSTIGLGFEDIISVDASGGKLYVTSSEDAGPALFWEFPLASYFLTEIDPAGPTAAPTVNVPGRFVQYDAANGILVLRDQQWNASGDIDASLESVAWTGGAAVTPVGSFALPSGAGNVLGRGGFIFFSAYDGGVGLHAVKVAAAGGLSAGADALVSKQWASLLDAAETSAYMTIGSGAIARYDFASGVSLTDLVEVMGSPWKMHFGAETAYVPLGYSGVAALPK